MEYPVTLFKGGESKEIKNSGEEALARQQGFCEPYKFSEYPKALYRNGERTEVTWDSIEKLHDGGCRVVKSKAEEDAARADGYRMLHEPAPEPAGEEPAGDASAKDDAKGQRNGKKSA